MAAIRISVAYIVLVLIVSSSTASLLNRLFRPLYDKYNEIYCDKYEACELAPEESNGCHTFSTGSLAHNITCLVKAFSNPNFAVYVKPGKPFQYFGLDIFYKVCVPNFPNEIGRFKILPQYFSDVDSWHELRIQRVPSSNSYHLLIEGEEQFASPESKYNITGTNFLITTQGSSSWSFNCDPRNFSSRSSLTPWVVLFILVLLMVFILASITIYLWRKSKKSSSILVTWRSSSGPSNVVTRPVMFTTCSQGPAGSDSCNRVNYISSTSYEHLYEEMDDTINNLPPRPPCRVPVVPSSSSPPQQRESAFSTINSVYSGVQDYQGKNTVMNKF